MIFILLALSLIGNFNSSEVARNRSSSSYNSYMSTSVAKNLLFTLHGKDGHIGVDDQNQMFITLYDVDRTVTYFTDRPNRKAGKTSLEGFLNNWRQSSKVTAGIATYVEGRAPAKFTQMSVVLSHPNYEKRLNRLTFDLGQINGEGELPKGDLGEVTLFIDQAQNQNIL